MAIDKIRTTAYQPSTNGGIERFHGTMHAMLAKWIQANQRDWDEKLPAVAFAYRVSEHESTGFSPCFLMHGREARIPADIAYGPTPNEPATESDFVADQQAALRSAFDLAQQQLSKAACRRMHAYDLRARPQAFAVGSWVWCLVPRRRQGRYRKWQCLYEGPFQVVKVLGPVTYQIQRTARSRPWTVHVDKLKPCHTEVRDDPATAAEPPPADSSSEPLVPNARPRRNIRLPARYA